MSLPAGIEVHYMEITDPDYMGPVALCDVKAGLSEEDEAPRHWTLSTILESEVTCTACKSHLEEP